MAVAGRLQPGRLPGRWGQCPAPGQEPWLYGHDGGTFGTTSIALTSADGSHQLSVGITGRDLTGATVPDLDSLLVPMLLATCEG